MNQTFIPTGKEWVYELSPNIWKYLGIDEMGVD